MAGNINVTDRVAEPQGLTYVPVYTEADFGTFAGDEVALVNNTWYDIKADIALSGGGWRFPVGGNVTISAGAPGVYTVTYTNANKPLFNGAATKSARLFNFDVLFNSGTQDVFDMTGDGTGELFMSVVNIVNIANAGFGLIDSFALFAFVSGQLINSSGELLVRDCTLGLTQSIITNAVDTSGALIALESTIPSDFEIINCKIFPNANESAIRISSGTQDPGSRIITAGITSGAPTGELFDPTGLDEMDPRVFSRSNPGRARSGNYIDGNLDANVTVTDMPAAGSWVMLAASTWVFSVGNRFTAGADGMMEYVGLEPNLVRMDGNVVMKPTTSNKTLSASYVRVGTEAISATFVNATDAIVAAGLVAGDSISFFNTPGTLPAELREDVLYYVIGATPLQLSYTSGGAAVAFTDDGTGPNTLDRATLVGSRSPVGISSIAPADVVLQGKTIVETGDKIGQFLCNHIDAVNIEASDGYTRV